MGEDKHAKVSLAFLRRKKRLGMMAKLLTKLISSSSKVRRLVGRERLFLFIFILLPPGFLVLCGTRRRRSVDATMWSVVFGASRW